MSETGADGTAAGPSKAWQCGVCGYVHRGAAPPGACPICGAAAADFAAYAEVAPAVAAPPGLWRCLNCGYEQRGTAPPAECPLCGAPRERFEAVVRADTAAGPAGPATRVLIVGAGIAGLAAAETIRDAAPAARITLVSHESGLPYYRLNLTRLLAGEIGVEDLPVHPESWYAERDIELLSRVEVTALDLAGRRVERRHGAPLPYERLILATGAHSFLPPIPGADLRGVFTLRTRVEADQILAAARRGLHCVCIGGGLLGLELAGGLARRGAEVTLLEGHEWLMPRQLNRTAGERLAVHVERAGIRLRTRARTAALHGSGSVQRVRLEDGVDLPADLVVVATGVRPNSHLARRSGLEVDKGIIVDGRLRTSHPDVLAAGDAAEFRGELYGSWSAAQYQGRIAGLNAVGLDTEFGGIPRSHTLKVLGLDLMSIGRFEPEDGSYAVVEERGEQRYLRFLFHDGRLAGAILLGDTRAAAAVKHAMERKRDFSGVLLRQAPPVAVLEDLLAGGAG